MSMIEYVFDKQKVRPRILGYLEVGELDSDIYQVEVSFSGTPSLRDPSANTLIRELDQLAQDSSVRLKTPTYDGDAELVSFRIDTGERRGDSYTAELHSVKWKVSATKAPTASTKVVVYVPESSLEEFILDAVRPSETAQSTILISRAR